MLWRNVGQRFFQQVGSDAVCARVTACQHRVHRFLRGLRVRGVCRQVHDRLHEREDARKHGPIVGVVDRGVRGSASRKSDAKRDPDFLHGVLGFNPAQRNRTPSR